MGNRNRTRIIGRELCGQLLTLEDCIPAMADVLKANAAGEVKMLPRSVIPHPGGNLLALMTASILPEKTAGSKVIIFPGPEAAKAGTSQGIIPLFETETGALKAIVDATQITVIRTASVSAAATDVLAVKNAETAAVLGTGRQGTAHALAMAKVRDLKRILLWNRTPDKAQAAAETLRQELAAAAAYGPEVIVCGTAEEAVREADIICTATPGRTDEPILKGEWLKPGTHVNAVGCVVPVGREVDSEAVRRSRVFFDWGEAAKAAGDIAIPLGRGEITEACFAGDIGSVMAGNIEGRTADSDITLFKSVGISAVDVAAAQVIYEKACSLGLGIEVEI